MKHILFFGDSNTWGYIPGSETERYPYDRRLCTVLQQALGVHYRVIEEGLCGRTTVFDDPLNEDRCGKGHLPMLLRSHAPLDLVVVMLGTNDLKHHLGLSPCDIALGAAKLVEMISTSDAGPSGTGPRVVLVAPAHVSSEDPLVPKFAGARAKSVELASRYQAVATEFRCGFFDAATVATCPVPDGIHLDSESIAKLGRALAAIVQNQLAE